MTKRRIPKPQAADRAPRPLPKIPGNPQKLGHALNMNPEEQVRSKLQGLGKQISAQLPRNFGFVLLCAPYGEKGGATLYLANITRLDALQLMREFIAVNMEERNFQREMPQLESDQEFEAWWEAQQRRPFQDTRQWCRDAFLAGRSTA